MKQLIVALLIVAIELGVVAVALLSYSIFRHGRRNRRDRAATLAAAQELRSAAPERRERRLSLLARVTGAAPEALQPRMEQLVAREHALYRRVHQAFARREGERLDGLGDDLDGLLEEYAAVLAEARPAQDGDRAEAMASENAELREELGSMRAELDRVLDEYCAAYARDQQDGAHRLRARMDEVLGDREAHPPTTSP